MPQLSSVQKKLLRWCLGNIRLENDRFLSISDVVLDGFCNVLLQDQRWAEILSADDVREVIWLYLEGKSKLFAGILNLHSDRENFEFLDKICIEVAQEFESYPRKYYIYIQLPGLYQGEGTARELKFSDSITLFGTTNSSSSTSDLIRPDGPIGDTVGASSIEEFMIAVAPMSAFLLRRETVYVQFLEYGFLSMSNLNQMPLVLSSALLKLKILLVFSMEIGLLERREVFYKYSTDGDRGGPAHVVCHEAFGASRACLNLPHDLANFLRGITFINFEKLNGSEVCRSLAPALEFIKKLDIDEHVVGIGAAIEWLLDSIISSNQTISLLQCCIGIESILGERGSGMYELGSTVRLAERYSYLMGTSVADRIRLREDFRKIFSKRGELVHARKTRLSLQDYWVVPKAQEILQRLIRKELSLHLGIDAANLSKMHLDSLRPPRITGVLRR